MEQNVAMSTDPRLVPAGGTRHATRVADVLLEVLGAQEGLRVSSLARRLGVGKAVVHRLLTVLEARGLLMRDRDRYSASPLLHDYAAHASQGSRLTAAAQPQLTRLHARTDETVILAARVRDHRVYLEQRVSSQPVRMSVQLGKHLPLHAGASGRAILAFAPVEVRAAILAGSLRQLTEATPTDPVALARQLEQTRADGFAISQGERQAGACSVSAPIVDASGFGIGALTICGPASRFTVENAAGRAPELLLAAAVMTEVLLATPSNASAEIHDATP